ncbi:MAG TPA: transcriptional regulator [Thermoanaerobaculia bacterium]|nr:transcriptional regulator [Thermoanaerobaculia bacterium]
MKLKTLFQVVSIGLVLMALATAPGEAASLASQSSNLDACSAPPGAGAARAKARRLVSQIRADLAAVEDQIRNVDFVAEVEMGTASVELIAAVVAEEYSIIRSDLNSFNQMAERWDSPQSQFFGNLAFGESLALPLLLDFAANVGLSEADLAAYEPRPKSQTYPSRVAWIASNADRASAAASFLVNFGVFGENMARVRDALLEVYGFTPEEVGFFSFFAEPIPGFEDAAIEVIAAGLQEGACPRDVRRSARLLQAYELDFWQAASDPPGSPLPVTWTPN